MAKAVPLTELAELGLDEPNFFHIQESYLRQVANSLPFTAKKKSKSEVAGTGAKMFRQKGTGRARQGERTNPHLHGGGRAFPPHPRYSKKHLNKHVRQSALRSAVLAHLLGGTAFVIEGGDFDTMGKTREIAAVLNTLPPARALVLVLASTEMPAWRNSQNIWNVQLVTPQHLSVRDLVECGQVVFAESALAAYRELLKIHLIPLVDEEDLEPVAAGAGTDQPGEGE